MKYIAHRGNINGPSPSENHPEYIQNALKSGFDVELDVWYRDEKWWLGHARPEHEMLFDFLHIYADRLWIHCKDETAMFRLMSHNQYGHGAMFNFFWHQNDDRALTSMGHIWTYPGKPLTPFSIAVMPEHGGWTQFDLLGIAGVCSDYVSQHKTWIDHYG